MFSSSMQRHNKTVGQIVQEFVRKKDCDNLVESNKTTSHMMRKPPKGVSGIKLDTRNLKNILEIDPLRQTLLVEPKVTMKEMVAATLPYGLVPAVIAEFKNITAGGAVIGTSLESSSHLFGQFNDICSAYTVLLGDGSIIRTSREENPDLFYALPGSFGSLGVLLSIEVKLIPTPGWVKLCCSRFNTISKAIEWMIELHNSKNPPDYLEGLIFNHEHVAVITGRHSLQDEGLEKIALGTYWSPWFYQTISQWSHPLPEGKFKEGMISIQDYLFRYDRGAFWMGSYALQGSLLTRFVTDNWGKTPHWLNAIPYANYAQLKEPGMIFRGLLGWMCSSKRLYKILHAGSEEWFAKRSIIQDFYIPAANAAKFAQECLARAGITPLWLCPIRTAAQEEFLAPHTLKGDLAFDIGIYGFPKKEPASELTKGLEELTLQLGGRKMLYSYSFYTENEFWKIYNKRQYEGLRNKYRANGVWPEMTDKVLQKI